MKNNKNKFLQSFIFQDVISEINSLGFKVSTIPSKNSTPYAVIGGRSNARWWLLPLENKYVTHSGLALFQPILASSQWIKEGAIILTKLGLGWIWAKPRLYITGQLPSANKLFGQQLSYAYFTGTNSPHRKMTIQIMDLRGSIHGYAKISRNEAIQNLLCHEANMLDKISKLDLKTAITPSILHFDNQKKSTILITDTLKKKDIKSEINLTEYHINFLKELYRKTSNKNKIDTVKILNKKYTSIKNNISYEMQYCFEKALIILNNNSKSLLPSALTHGDFTPWNTFTIGKKIYVFDWEYAKTHFPPCNDLIHFLLSVPCNKKLTNEEKINKICIYTNKIYKIDKYSALNHIILYLLYINIHYISRIAKNDQRIMNYKSINEYYKLINFIINK